MLQQLENGHIYISKGTPMPFMCPKCNAVIPVASLDGQHQGVDRFLEIQKCWACDYSGTAEEFDVEWEFHASQ